MSTCVELSSEDLICFRQLDDLGIQVWLPAQDSYVLSEAIHAKTLHAETNSLSESGGDGVRGLSEGDRQAGHTSALGTVTRSEARKVSQGAVRSDEAACQPSDGQLENQLERPQPHTLTSHDPTHKGDKEVPSYALLLQRIGDRVLLVCDLADPEAPGLSAQESQLFSGLLKAVSERITPQCSATISQDVFRWPPSSLIKHSWLAAEAMKVDKAVEGLLDAQAECGVSDVIFLSDRLSQQSMDLNVNCRLHFVASLRHMATGDRSAKGSLWSLLQTLLG